MTQIKTLAFKKEIVVSLAQFSLFLSLMIATPALKQQLLTGTIINALFFISVVLLGRRAALLLAFLPSVFALFFGLLPAVMAPVIPLIILGNMILILLFDFLRKKNFWLGFISAGLLKFGFLTGFTLLFFGAIFKGQIPTAFQGMMAWPQLFTVLAGGVLAHLLLKNFKKTDAR